MNNLRITNVSPESANRIWKKIKRDRVSGCWIWTGYQSHGYGQVRVNKILYRIHRFMYAWLIGPIPNGKGKHIPVLDHLCNNRSCCNPAHLQLLDDRENILKGNGATAKKFRQTHCKNGHLLPEPIRGHRRCMICHRAWNRRNYAKNPEPFKERSRLNSRLKSK